MNPAAFLIGRLLLMRRTGMKKVCRFFVEERLGQGNDPKQVGISRCDVPARVSAGGTINFGLRLRRWYAARTAQRAVPT
jgi:hypothetical protein